ncbi:MAG: hypothetical protein LUC83_09940 [Clostridiales bacterium]|nr:hypothetical protein [Clostridiales bacterium]
MRQLKKPLRWMKQELAEEGKDWKLYGVLKVSTDGSTAVMALRDDPSVQIIVENHGWRGS